MKHTFRRMMSMVLTISMITSMIGVMPAFAAEPDTHPTNGGSEWQISGTTDPKYYVVGENTKGTTTTDDDVEDADSAVNTAENGKVSVSKTIAPTGIEDEFIITLEVNTLERIEALNLSSDAAVVLVIDNSSSMYQNTADKLGTDNGNSTKLVNGDSTPIPGEYYTNWEGKRSNQYVELPNNASADYFDYVTGAIEHNGKKYIPYIQNARIPYNGNDKKDWRITLAKSAATTFADDFMNDISTSGLRYVSVVSFSTDAQVETGWTDDYETVKTAIDAMRPINMTYMAPGLNKANELLQQDKVKDIQNKYVILLADGAANDSAASVAASKTVNNAENTELYTVSFAKTDAMSELAGIQYDSANFTNLIANLADIQKEIVKAAEAWTVTDPMGDNIVLDSDSFELIDCENKDKNVPSVTVKENGFTWNLRAVTPDESGSGGNKTYTYKLQYGITLDTDAEGFAEGTYYLTNGQTYLDYCIKESENGTTSTLKNGTIDFNVPAVKGEFPDYSYTVNHYLQTGFDGDEIVYDDTPVVSYKVAEGVQKNDVVVKNSYDTTGVNSNTYTNYTYANFDTTGGKEDEVAKYSMGKFDDGITITQNGQELNFYYTKDTTSAIVYHEYYKATVDKDGKLCYVLDRDKSEMATVKENRLFIGDIYNAQTKEGNGYTLYGEPEYGPSAVHSTNENYELTLLPKFTNDTGEIDTHNKITFKYRNTLSSEEYVQVVVNHTYVDYTWEINTDTGRYELTAEAVENQERVLGTAVYKTKGSNFNAVLNTQGDAYTLDESATSDQYTNVTLDEELTTINLVYRADEPKTELDGAAVVVNHIYQANKSYVDINGALHENELVTEDTDEGTVDYTTYFAGEKFVAESRGGHNHTITYANTSTDTFEYQYEKVEPSLTINSLPAYDAVTGEGLQTIDIYYVREDNQLEPVTVTVKHHYEYTYEEVVDGVVGIRKATGDDVDSDETANLKKYVGESYTAAPQNEFQLEGFDSMNFSVISTSAGKTEDGADKFTISPLIGGENVISIYYELKATLKDDANVIVTHTYNDYVKTYKNGKLVTELDSTHKGENDTYAGSDNEKYTAVPKAGEYTLVGTPELDVTLKSGTTQQIDLVYERTTEKYVSTGVTVNHIYTTYTTTVNEAGEIVVVEDVVRNDGAVTHTDAKGNTLYEGMLYTTKLIPNGYVPTLGNRPYTILKADEGDNVINLNYVKFVNDLELASVQVIHHYTASYTALGEDNQPHTTVTNSTTKERTKYFKIAGQFYTGNEKLDGYTAVEGQSTAQTIKLEPGHNEIHFYYVKSNDVTKEATLDVTHIYKTEYMSGKETTIDSTYDDDTVKSYATVKLAYDVDTQSDAYAVETIESTNASVDKVDHTIVLEEGANKITITYVKTEDDRAPVNVTVIHNYYTYDEYTNNSNFDGSTTKTKLANLQDVTYTVGEDGKIFIYDENEYIFRSFTGESTITLSEVSSENVIILNYQRTVDTTPPPIVTPSYYTLTVNWVDEDGNALASQQKTSGYTYTAAYETTQKAFDGYTFLKMSDSSDPASGIMNGNRTVTYVYTAVTDIPEVDPPLTEIPDEPDVPTTPPAVDIPEIDIPLTDIPEIEIPLTDVPQTGDTRNIALYAAIAMMSALGLAWLTKTEYDEKKRTEN